MIGLLSAILLLFLVTAFLAATEMAFISVHPVRLRDQAGKGNRGARGALKLREKSQHFLGTILIATNMSQVGLIALASYFLEQHFFIHSELAVTLIVAMFVLVFCEMGPKEYARLHALSFLMHQERWLTLLYRIFYWPAHAFIRLTEIIFPNYKKKHEKIFTNEVEFKALVSESQKKGVIDPHERDFVNMILDFERISVRSVMIPLAQVACVELRSDIRAVREIAKEKGERVVFVFEDDPSIVAGVIYVFDVLRQEREEGSLNEFLKAPLFISEEMSLEEAFQILQRKRQSFALVMDSRYDVIGVVPIESLLLGRQ